MKQFIPASAVILTIIASTLAWAGGDSVNNGGVIWACRSGGTNQVFHSGLLVDLYETQILGRTLVTDPGHDPMAFYELRKQWLARELPDMFTALTPRFEYLELHRRFIDAELLPTNDYNFFVKPPSSSCAQGSWQNLNIANFRETDQQLLISSELWNSSQIPSVDKAALLFHEAVYYWMRTYFGATNSDKARQITGLLFTTLSIPEMKTEMTKILGSYPDHPEGKFICVMKNEIRNQIYVAFDQDMIDASWTVRQRCQNDPDPKMCRPSSVECEELENPDPQYRCVSENHKTGKIYTARGRNILEGKFNVHMACYFGSQAQGTSAQDCSDFSFIECY